MGNFIIYVSDIFDSRLGIQPFNIVSAENYFISPGIFQEVNSIKK